MIGFDAWFARLADRQVAAPHPWQPSLAADSDPRTRIFRVLTAILDAHSKIASDGACDQTRRAGVHFLMGGADLGVHRGPVLIGSARYHEVGLCRPPRKNLNRPHRSER